MVNKAEGMIATDKQNKRYDVKLKQFDWNTLTTTSFYWLLTFPRMPCLPARFLSLMHTQVLFINGLVISLLHPS